MRLLFSLTLLFILSGCQFVPINAIDADAQIDALLQADRYDDALSAIESNNPELSTRKQEVELARTRYINGQIKEINELLKSNEWYNARLLLQASLKKVPSSVKLQQLDIEADQSEQAFIDEKMAIQRLAEGTYLINSMPTYEAITDTAPDKLKYRRELNRMQNRSLSLAKTLVQYAQVNFDNLNFQTAQDAIDIAKRLDSNIEAPELEQELTAYWAKQKQLKDAKKAALRKRSIGQLETNFKKALDKDDLFAAQNLMANLWDMDANNPKRVKQQNQLNDALSNRIETGLKRGEQLYNLGNITEALTLWSALLPLQPGHVGLNERIARANRFIDNLERLQKEKPGP